MQFINGYKSQVAWPMDKYVYLKFSFASHACISVILGCSYSRHDRQMLVLTFPKQNVWERVWMSQVHSKNNLKMDDPRQSRFGKPSMRYGRERQVGLYLIFNPSLAMVTYHLANFKQLTNINLSKKLWNYLFFRSLAIIVNNKPHIKSQP